MKNYMGNSSIADNGKFLHKKSLHQLVYWGLNHQIEHHIFPHISHIHYTDIAKIVKKTAKEFNLPYNEYKTTRSALFSHFKHLKNMGVQPA
jgi:linoleoyl-CoA desaturase